ncbi:RNA lariat debranching enzyme [Martiniozyma asiatica (nom. inval.)]|nr:RNA lariat debranching enzyme [Martiniozyma asiatica]
MRIAIEGCCHGSLDAIYARLEQIPPFEKPELLIICGDFQSIRDKNDLKFMSVPDKYKQLGDFHRYYSGESVAPILTLFIGGNHEASNYLEEVKFGGFVASNIYYLGRSGVVWYKGLRICGLSGIYNSNDWAKLPPDNFQFLNSSDSSSMNVNNNLKPFDDSGNLFINDWAVRKSYHTRKDDFIKLNLVSPDNKMVFVSHDWPEGIYNYGNVNQLTKFKPHFKKDIYRHELGNPWSMQLMRNLKPNWWFSAHLHCKFEATINWSTQKRVSPSGRALTDFKKTKVDSQEIPLDFSDSEEGINKDEIELEIDSDADAGTEETLSKSAEAAITSNFLALDKCLPKRKFLEVMDLPLTDPNHESVNSNCLLYDKEFICIQRVYERNKAKIYHLKPHDLSNTYEPFKWPKEKYSDSQLY